MNTASLNPMILSLVTFIPAVGGFLILLIPRRDRDIKVFAFVISILAFVASLHLPVHLHRNLAGFQFEIDKPWIASPNIHYHMGIDGISVWLVVLTTFLTPLCVLISWTSIHERVKEFFVLLLLLETALIGVFTSLDLFLFYFFWEATLIPMALLIGMYGHGRKVYAAVKYFLFTMIGSMFMLAAILWLYVQGRQLRFCGDPERDSQRQRRGLRLGRAMALSRLLHRLRREGSSVSLFTHGCRMPTSRRPQQVRFCWPAFSSRWARMACSASISRSSPSRRAAMPRGS